MKEKLKRLIDQYLREAKKRSFHHIDVSVPGHDGRFWVLDLSLIVEQPDNAGVQLAIYFSLNPQSNKGKRIMQVIDLLDPFEKYQEARDGRFTVYYLVTDNNSTAISTEVAAKIQALFPTLNLNEVQLSLEDMNEWSREE